MTNFLSLAFNSLSQNINKLKSNRDNMDNEQGVVSEKFPELKIELDNQTILELAEKWEKSWKQSSVLADWQKAGEENKRYWQGKQFDMPMANNQRQLIDNAIFESVETYLPQVTRRNPEPMVSLRPGEEEIEQNQQFIKTLQAELGDIASEVKLRLKLKKGARHWAIFLLGVGKPGWDLDKDIPTIKIIRPQKLILDPDAITDEDGYSGEFIGEYRKMQASKLVDILESMDAEPGAVDSIKKLVDTNLGTEIQFIEWWTDQYMFWQMGKNVLLKIKNPHWNYDKDQPMAGEDGQPMLDEDQQPQSQQIPGFNHFTTPKKPYIFLSVFNLGDKPVDDVSLIGQSLSTQDLINKRLRQIDKNADSMNGGMVVSLERSGLNVDQAKNVTDALRKGGTIAIPTGAVTDAIQRMSAPELPLTVYNQMQDSRNRLRDVFGTSGLMPAGVGKEKTVRGKYQIQGLDTDRIGGGFSEYLEQFADDTYNWWVQLLYVYDEKYAGKQLPKVRVDVKEGSLLPKDSTTVANQAIELSSAGKMSLLDLYKRLDYPNPDEMAANAWLEANAPEMLYDDPRIKQVIESRQQANNKPPSASINYKDLPPDGQAQLARLAGIELDPEAVAAYDELQNEKADKKVEQKNNQPKQ